MSQHRERRLKQAKTPLSAAAWRFFLAPQYTVDDYYACSAECKVKPEAADDLLQFYYFADGWKEIWRDHKVQIDAEFAARFPDPEKRAAHKRWALQCFQDRLHAKFIAERDRTRIN
jgi:hypothetical protein